MIQNKQFVKPAIIDDQCPSCLTANPSKPIDTREMSVS